MASIKECIDQISIFPHSEDYYQILQESKQFDLMNLYLEGFEFVLENSELYNEFSDKMIDGLSSDYITEGVWHNFLDSFKKAIVNILKWIYRILETTMISLKALFNFNITIEQMVKVYSDISKNKTLVSDNTKPAGNTANKLIDSISEFKNKDPLFYQRMITNDFDGNQTSFEIINFKDTNEIYSTIKYLIRNIDLSEEYQTFLKNIFVLSMTRKYEVPAFLSVFHNNQEALLKFIDVMKKTFSKDKVTNPYFNAIDIKQMNKELEECKKNNKTYLLPINKIEELQKSFNEIKNGIADIIQLINKHVMDDSKFTDNPEKREEFKEILWACRDTMMLLQDQTPKAIKMLAYYRDSINRCRNFLIKIHPIMKEIYDQSTPNE